MTADERARALITASVNGLSVADEARDMSQVEFASMMGVLLAYCNNLVQLVALLWGVTPEEAWQQILSTERELREEGGTV